MYTSCTRRESKVRIPLLIIKPMKKKVMNRRFVNREMFFLAIVLSTTLAFENDIMYIVVNEWHHIYRSEVVKYSINVGYYLKSFKFHLLISMRSNYSYIVKS